MFLIYVNDIHQVLNSNKLLYAVDLCFMYQIKDKEIEKQLQKNLENIMDWYFGGK